MVNIALCVTPISACEAGDANHDGQITVDEILRAVSATLAAWRLILVVTVQESCRLFSEP